VKYNECKIITLADPCIIDVNKIRDSENNTVHFVTDMLPYRLAGVDNFATFAYRNLSSISIVSSENFINI
jgi:hypothetical protein